MGAGKAVGVYHRRARPLRLRDIELRVYAHPVALEVGLAGLKGVFRSGGEAVCGEICVYFLRVVRSCEQAVVDGRTGRTLRYKGHRVYKLFGVHGRGLRKGIDVHPREVEILQEGADYHRCGVPPDGIADEQRVISVKVLRQVGNGGPGAAVAFRERHVPALAVVLRIWRLRLYFQQVAAGAPGYVRGHLRRVARPGEIRHQYV